MHHVQTLPYHFTCVDPLYCFLDNNNRSKAILTASHAPWKSSALGPGDMFQPHLKYTLKCFHPYASRSRYFITTLFHSSVHFSSVLVKGLYQTESYSHHLISIRLYFILTILITEDDQNHIFFNNCN
jgi:hypothetical protein